MATANPPLASIPLVCVVWDDAHDGQPGEFTKKEISELHHKPALIWSFGLLLLDDETGITLVREITDQTIEAEDTIYRIPGFIPRGMVREVINLGIPRRKSPRKPRKETPSNDETS